MVGDGGIVVAVAGGCLRLLPSKWIQRGLGKWAGLRWVLGRGGVGADGILVGEPIDAGCRPIGWFRFAVFHSARRSNSRYNFFPGLPPSGRVRHNRGLLPLQFGLGNRVVFTVSA